MTKSNQETARRPEIVEIVAGSHMVYHDFSKIIPMDEVLKERFANGACVGWLYREVSQGHPAAALKQNISQQIAASKSSDSHRFKEIKDYLAALKQQVRASSYSLRPELFDDCVNELYEKAVAITLLNNCSADPPLGAKLDATLAVGCAAAHLAAQTWDLLPQDYKMYFCP